MSPSTQPQGARYTVLVALALLYAAQGIPFGFAAEYLPVVLRGEGASLSAIAAVGWLQLPWQLKTLWASAADHPRVRPYARSVLLALQCALAAVMASYAFVGSAHALAPWFVLTGIAALLAATQDIFVDAFAVRTLHEHERGWGNSAQVAGYRLGMILGGGALLVLSGRMGTPATLVACGSFVAAAGLGAFALRGDAREVPSQEHEHMSAPMRTAASSPRTHAHLMELRAMVAHLVGRGGSAVALVALTYKLGIHAAAVLIKPMLVDAGWSRESIGALAVTFGTGAGVLGSLAGGALHRVMGERRALVTGAVLHAVAVLPLAVAVGFGCPRGMTTAAVAIEHAASGAGTTVLFAALMTATQRDRAALHYTALTSLNALAIGVGGAIGGALGDLLGMKVTFVLAAGGCLGPIGLLGQWSAKVRASAGEQN